MAQPPGWYADVTMPGFERWWDGGSWSHVTRPVPGTTPPAPPTVPSTEPSPPAGNPYASPDPHAPSPAAQPGLPQAPAGTPYASGQYGTPQYGTAQYGTAQYGVQQYPGQPYPGAMPYQVPAAGPVTPDGAPLASVWARLGAAVIDGLLTGIVGAALSFPQMRIVWDAYRKLIDDAVAAGSSGGPAPDTQALLNDPAMVRALLAISVIGVAVRVVYSTVMVALRGATLGKMAIGAKVRRVAAPGPVGWGTALLRAVAAVVPGVIPIVSYIYPWLDPAWCLWDGQRQCLHDKIARTVVVRAR